MYLIHHHYHYCYHYYGSRTMSIIYKDIKYNLKKFNYTPHRGMQSWSTNNDRAAEFGEAIVIADSKDSNYFMNPEYFSKISYQNDDEHETIHVGKKMKVWIGIEEAWFNDLIK